MVAYKVPVCMRRPAASAGWSSYTDLYAARVGMGANDQNYFTPLSNLCTILVLYMYRKWTSNYE